MGVKTKEQAVAFGEGMRKLRDLCRDAVRDHAAGRLEVDVIDDFNFRASELVGEMTGRAAARDDAIDFLEGAKDKIEYAISRLSRN